MHFILASLLCSFHGKLPSSPLGALNELDKILVQTGVCRQFGMESRSELVALPDSNDVAIHCGKDFDRGGKCAVNIRCTDESHGEILGNTRNLADCMEAAQLASVCIAANIDVHRAKSLSGLAILQLCQLDESCTSAKDGQPLQNGLADGAEKPQGIEQMGLSGRFAAGDDERILRLLPVLQLANLESLHAQRLQYLLVLYERPLQG